MTDRSRNGAKAKYPLSSVEYWLYRRLSGGEPASATVRKLNYAAQPWLATLWTGRDVQQKKFATHAAAVKWAHQQVAIKRGAA